MLVSIPLFVDYFCMSENPTLRKVQVNVTPVDPDLEGKYYISLELGYLECQLMGEKFALAARRAVQRTLTGGKIFVKSDGQPVFKPGDTRHFDGVWLKPDEIVIEGIRHFVDSEGKALTDSSDDTKIVSQAN